MSESVQVPVTVSPARIEKHGSLLVAGVSQVYKLGDDFTPLWDELNQKASPAMLDILAVTQYIGVCTQPSTDGFVRYTAGILVETVPQRINLGWVCWNFPRAPTRWLRSPGRFRGLSRQVLRALSVSSSRRIRSTAR